MAISVIFRVFSAGKPDAKEDGEKWIEFRVYSKLLRFNDIAEYDFRITISCEDWYETNNCMA